MIETVVCTIPNFPLELDDDLPHPDIEGAYISPYGTEFLVDMWILNANPFHAAQPAMGLPTGNIIVVNRGRKIATRGDVSVSI